MLSYFFVQVSGLSFPAPRAVAPTVFSGWLQVNPLPFATFGSVHRNTTREGAGISLKEPYDRVFCFRSAVGAVPATSICASCNRCVFHLAARVRAARLYDLAARDHVRSRCSSGSNATRLSV